jgi:hypothetical protein
MSLVQPATLAEYVGEDTIVPEMGAAIERAEAIAASRLGCRELRSRTITETISVVNEYDEVLSGLSTNQLLRFPVVFLSDGPAKLVSSMTFDIGTASRDILSTARISETGWAVRYRFPFGMGFTIDMPFVEASVTLTYEAGWRTEADLPSGIRQFVIAQATQVYATPIGGVIKVRLGDNYVDLNPAAIAKQVDQYAEMLDQWVRVRL